MAGLGRDEMVGVDRARWGTCAWVTTDSPGQERAPSITAFTRTMMGGMALGTGDYFGGTGVWTGTGCRGSSAAPRERRGMRPGEIEMGERGVGPCHTMFWVVDGTPILSLVHGDKAGPRPPRALLQVYDTEGTASSSPDGLVRLWVGRPRLNLEGGFGDRLSCTPPRALRMMDGLWALGECGIQSSVSRVLGRATAPTWLSRTFRWCNGKTIRVRPCMKRAGWDWVCPPGPAWQAWRDKGGGRHWLWACECVFMPSFNSHQARVEILRGDECGVAGCRDT